MWANALMYNDSYLVHAQLTKGTYDILYHLPKSVIAYACVMVIKHILLLLAFNDRGIRKIQHDNTPRDALLNFIRHDGIFIFNLYIIILPWWYYVTAFILCSV